MFQAAFSIVTKKMREKFIYYTVTWLRIIPFNIFDVWHTHLQIDTSWWVFFFFFELVPHQPIFDKDQISPRIEEKTSYNFFFFKSFRVIIENPNITIIFICDFFLNSTSFCLLKIKNSIFFSWSLFVRTDLLCIKGCFILQNFSAFVI